MVAMYSGSDHAISAEKPLLQLVSGVKVGFVARFVCTQMPTSPELLITVYVAPAGGAARASTAVSSRPSTASFQLGVDEEALRVSQIPPPVTCITRSGLNGSISTSSGQPQKPPSAGVRGMVAAISRQVVPPSSDHWMTS